MYDLIILGGGPAGMAAAIYAMRAKLNTLLIEQGAMGGQVLSTYEVDNYPGLPGISGMELGEKMREHASRMGILTVCEQVKEIIWAENERKVITDSNTYETKTLLVASGAKHTPLMVPGEEELAGMGVSYCATCDGAFYKDLTVAVVGGGDVALEDAIFLARGCKKVYVIHRRDEFRGAKILQEALQELSNVEILWNTVVTSINGEDGEVQGVTIRDVKNQEEKDLELEGVFIAVGIRPDSELLEGIADRDANGYVIADETCATSAPGIFAAGDVRKKPLRQVVTAVADGANAVYAVQDYLIRNR